MCKSGMMAREGYRKMFSEPFDSRHVVVIVSMDLTKLLYQAKAKLLFCYEGTIHLLLRFWGPKEKIWEWPTVDAAVEWRRGGGERSHVVKNPSELAQDDPPLARLKAWPKMLKRLSSDILHE